MRTKFVLAVIIANIVLPFCLQNVLAQTVDGQNMQPAPEAQMTPELRSVLRGDHDEAAFGRRPDINFSDDPLNQEFVTRRCGNNWCIDTGNFQSDTPPDQIVDPSVPNQSPTIFRFRRDFTSQK